MTAVPSDAFRFCVAPMLDWTDRHERYFLRLMSKRARLYTEMVTTGALLNGDQSRHLDFHYAEHPLALQLGGSNPDELARCAEIAQQWQYDEINLNVGCPSDRVQSGRFGACLMADPELVARCITAMQNACDIPVTVKSRVGIDDHDSDEFLQNFIKCLYQAGCRIFIIHARIALLDGLSPKENREIPPLQYDRVERLKAAYPDTCIVLNGGIRSLAQSQEMLQTFDGVMLGREAYQNPYIMVDVDNELFGDTTPTLSRAQVVQAYLPYVSEQLSAGVGLHHMTRHILGLYKGQPGGKLFRRHLSEHAWRKSAGISVLEDAVTMAESQRSSTTETQENMA
jgi:tRNA-dihydrouridine synthase A